MAKKDRTGLQIRFHPEFEQDIIEFFSPLKKAEVHITAISAFRMYMRSVGFYSKRRFENPFLLKIPAPKNDSRVKEPGEGLFDEEALQTLAGMFDKQNNIKEKAD